MSRPWKATPKGDYANKYHIALFTVCGGPSCLCAVLFLLFLTLGLSEAQRIYYTKGTDAAQLPRRDKEEKRPWTPAFLSALLSPTFLICTAAFFAVTLFA